MRTLFLTLTLLLALGGGGLHTAAAAPPPPHWTKCVLRFSAAGGFESKLCYHIAIRHAPGARAPGHRWWIDRAHSTKRRQVRITYPRFVKPTPQPRRMLSLWVTGYSWNCGAAVPYGRTASGTVPRAAYTIASNDPSIWHHWVSIPSLGLRGYVEDRGAPLDIFAPNCGVALTYTGQRTVLVY